MVDKDYVVILQCHIVKERCSGYYCEQAFHQRADGFADYARDRPYRMIFMTCGGCCGKATMRKLAHLVRKVRKAEGIGPDRIVVQLASCITKDNRHSPRCLFADYIKGQVARAGLECREDTHLSPMAEARRRDGLYGPRGKVGRSAGRPRKAGGA
jgi:predicted metal-binding protein